MINVEKKKKKGKLGGCKSGMNGAFENKNQRHGALLHWLTPYTQIRAVYCCFLPLYLAQALVYTLCQVLDSPSATLSTLLHPSDHLSSFLFQPATLHKIVEKEKSVKCQLIHPSRSSMPGPNFRAFGQQPLSSGTRSNVVTRQVHTRPSNKLGLTAHPEFFAPYG